MEGRNTELKELRCCGKGCNALQLKYQDLATDTILEIKCWKCNTVTTLKGAIGGEKSNSCVTNLTG